MESNCTTNGTRREDRTDKPESVAVTSHHTPIGRVGGLNDVDGTCCSGDRDAKTEHEASSHELADAGIGDGKTAHDCTEDDQKTAQKHADTATPCVDCRTNKGESTDTADLVHGRDDACPDARIAAMEVVEEDGVGEQTIE